MSTEELNNSQDPDAKLGAVAEEDDEIKHRAANETSNEPLPGERAEQPSDKSGFPAEKQEIEERQKHEHKSDGSCGCKH